MTLRDEIPIQRCAVRGCPVIGRWPEGERCPEHRLDAPRIPTWIEAQEADDE